MVFTTFDYFAVFLSSYFVVFLLGLQSKNVNNSRYLAAIVTSFFISVGQFFFIRYAATGQLLAFAVCAVGGCAGIATSIFIYDHFTRSKAK